MSKRIISMVVVVLVAAPVVWAQQSKTVLDGASLEAPREPAKPGAQNTPRSLESTQGPAYTWEDGDRTMRVRLQSDLEVSGDDRSGGGEHIVTKDSSRRSSGQPVFRSESGTLMTLPGGVLLVLAAEWSRAETNTFFAQNGINPGRVSELGYVTNGFFVETAPGFPSLELANALVAQDRVLIIGGEKGRQSERLIQDHALAGDENTAVGDSLGAVLPAAGLSRSLGTDRRTRSPHHRHGDGGQQL